MVSLPKPEVILTHESDLDGFLSGLLLRRLARHLFETDVPLQAYHNHNWRQRSLAEKSAWVCDLAFEARLDKPNWVIIDHHTTDFSPKHAQLVHDVNKSAGLLSYELCQQHELGSPQLDRLMHLNDVADLFLEDDPDFVLASDYANASGAILPRSIQNIPDAIAYLRQVLNPPPAKGSPLNNLESLFDAIELAKK